MLEALILTGITLLLISVGMKHVVAGIEKSKYYNVRNNLLELTYEEKELISEVVLDITENKDIYNKIITENSVANLEYEKSYSNNKNLSIEIKDGIVYLVTKKYDSRRYRKMDVKIKLGEESTEILFIPTLYRSDYISK